MYAVKVQYTIALFLHTGGHLGRDKTYDKIAAKFYWKNMYEDVTSYVRRCHLCQTTNDKFTEPNAQLHPIKVDPVFWSKVRKNIVVMLPYISIMYTLIVADWN